MVRRALPGQDPSHHAQDRDAELNCASAAAMAAQAGLVSEQADTLLGCLTSSPWQARSWEHTRRYASARPLLAQGQRARSRESRRYLAQSASA
jgi:hypothetical protein